MFDQRRRSRKGLFFFLTILAIFLGSNALGYFLARDQIKTALEPTAMPEEAPLPFGLTFRLLLPKMVVNAPYEVGIYSMAGAYPRELSLRYEALDSDAKLTATISDRKYFYEENRPIRFPESIMARGGFPGPFIYEIFAKGPGSDGISANPYAAIREGLVARLRGALSSAAAPATLTEVSVVGGSIKGQVWRIYRNEKDEAVLAEGTVYEPDAIANITLRFSDGTKEVGAVVNAFANAVTFKESDISINETLADACISDLPHDVEAHWEDGCRQSHLVALLISKGDTLNIAKRLYGDYSMQKDKVGIQAIYDEMHFEMHYTKGWEDFIKSMETENPWLLPKKEKQGDESEQTPTALPAPESE